MDTSKDYRKDFHMNCVIAAFGTYERDDYATFDFENIIGYEDDLIASTCAHFISFIKNTVTDRKNIPVYATRENFNLYFFDKKGKDSYEQREFDAVEAIYKGIDNRKVGILKDPNLIWNNLSIARKKLDLAKSLGYEDVTQALFWDDKYCKDLQKKLRDALDAFSQTDSHNKVLFADDLYERYKQTIEDRKKGKIYSFHSAVFDSLITEGPTPGHGGIIGGSTGMGKSALCLNLINDLIVADVPTMYFPIEMGVNNTLDRLAAIRTGQNFKDIIQIGKKADIAQEVEDKIIYEINGLRAHPNFAIIDDANLNVAKLSMYIRRFQDNLFSRLGRNYCIVIIDLLTMIKEFYDDGASMAQQIEKAINKLDILAKDLNFHWIGVVQLNRSVESDKVQSVQSIDKLRPTRSAIKNSSALLERSRWAITIFRKKYFADLYLSQEEANTIEDIAEIQLMKANDEAIGRRYMTFDGATFKMGWNENYGKSSNGADDLIQMATLS